MRFKNQQQNSQLPEVNLVPMMDVLMTVLTFFIIISMTLSGESVNVFLPNAEGDSAATKGEEAPKTLVIGLNADKELLFKNEAIALDQLSQEMQAFLSANPDGIVVLKADRELAYQDVTQVLKFMRDIGGSRVSLGVEPKS